MVDAQVFIEYRGENYSPSMQAVSQKMGIDKRHGFHLRKPRRNLILLALVFELIDVWPT